MGRLDMEMNDAVLWSSAESPGGTRHYNPLRSFSEAAFGRPFSFQAPGIHPQKASLLMQPEGLTSITHGIHMAEPITIASGVTSATVGITFASMFPEATPGVMLCALAGAAMYVLTSEPHQLWKQMLFAVISFIGGVFFSIPMAKILAGVINAALGLLTPPASIEVSPNVGALVAASISVAVLLRIVAKSRRGKMPGLEEEGK